MYYLSDTSLFSYSPNEIRRSVRVDDVWRFGVAKNDLDQIAQQTSDSFLSTGCSVQQLKKVMIKGNSVFSPATIYDQLCLRRTNTILKQATRLPVLNRNSEIRQLLRTIRAEKDCNIVRIDIASFFESLSFSKIVDRLKADGIRNHTVLRHLRNLNNYLQNTFDYHGLPRGLALSSTLSEYALKDFDHFVCGQDHVLYYARYVDDICILHFSDPVNFLSELCNGLQPGLNLNAKKTQNLKLPSPDQIEYLGYRIDLSPPHVVTLAESKIKKAKRRIIAAFQDYGYRNDFDLLLDRLRFLSSKSKMRKVGRRTPVLTGFRHVYRHATEEPVLAQLRSLDKFLHGIVSSKRYSLSKVICRTLQPLEIKQLRTVSFESGYSRAGSISVSANRIAKIKRAWQYA